MLSFLLWFLISRSPRLEMLQRSTATAILPASGEATGFDVTVVLTQSEVSLFWDADVGMAHKIPVTLCGSCARPSATQKYLPCNATVLRLHTSILSSLSGYFRTRFSTDLGHLCQECREITLPMEGREFEAAHSVFTFMQTSELPTNNGVVADGMLLVWMLKVRWEQHGGVHRLNTTHHFRSAQVNRR